jgi:hypothetical protein
MKCQICNQEVTLPHSHSGEAYYSGVGIEEFNKHQDELDKEFDKGYDQAREEIRETIDRLLRHEPGYRNDYDDGWNNALEKVLEDQFFITIVK